jgi:hypothetical protein
VQVHLVEQLGLHFDVHPDRGFQVVRAFQSDVGLHDRYQALGLANQRVSRQIPHVGFDCQIGRLAVRDVDFKRRPPLTVRKTKRQSRVS